MAESQAFSSWWEWHFHSDVILGVLLLESIYLLGVGPIRKRVGWAAEVEIRNVILFSTGALVLFIALTSPIHHLGDNFLFSAHMVQHLLLILVTPPLLLLGTPGWLLAPMIRIRLVCTGLRFITQPIIAFCLFTFVLSLWHLPALYDLTLRNHTAHIAEHLLFIATSVIMWWPVLSPVPEVPRANYPLQMVYLFFLSLPPGFIGAAITFSQGTLYTWYDTVPRLWGLSVVADQQIGGLIMKIPGALTFLATMVVVFFIWFSHDSRHESEIDK
ncbi:cytochrome c oxidase assembly protein [Dehalococcoidia bacterium]|nr:cytochrome c oxidase assembly protein [Dehalococcoidia bacterium]